MNKLTILAIILITTTAGCVIVTDREDFEDWNYSSNSWEREQERNREAIADLALGTSVEQVRQTLGDPDFSEAYRNEGHDYLILRYRTHHRHSDGDTTQDETTPLLFEDGVLVAWGETVLAQMVN